MLTPPPAPDWSPHLGEILDPPLDGVGAQEIFKFSTPSGTGTRGLLPPLLPGSASWTPFPNNG